MVDGNRVAVEVELGIAGVRTAVADFFVIEGSRIRRLAVYMGPALPTTT